MRKTFVIGIAALVVLAAVPAFAELQNVTVGGEVRIRADYYSNTVASPTGAAVRWPGVFLPARPIGDAIGGQTVVSRNSWDNDGNSLGFVEQRTRLNVKADFTDQVSAFIELDSYDIWGEDFRSDYVTGADFRATTTDDVEVYQAYIEVNDMWDEPLRLRIGRQELALGNQWLVGVNDTSSFFTGLSFDAIRLTYAMEDFSIDAFAATLAEGGVAEEDEDVWLYGLYGSYSGLEDITIDAYALWVRDAQMVNDTNFVWLVEWIEDWLDVDDYDVTNLYTIGLRGNGTIDAFDFAAEVAFQFGDANLVGSMFRPFGVYGDDDADFDAWAADVVVGYTFEAECNPRVYLGGAYLDGEDNRDISFWDWLNPFDRPEASVSFNRLFSNTEYSEFLDSTDLSNCWVIRGGVTADVSENAQVELKAAYFVSVDEFDAPRYVKLGRFRVPVAPALSFWDQENDDELGWEVGLYGTYNYSEDLVFKAGWAHLFVGDGLEDGQYSTLNGLGFNGGSDDDDADYLFFETCLSF